jgi:hypothetical protein
MSGCLKPQVKAQPKSAALGVLKIMGGDSVRTTSDPDLDLHPVNRSHSFRRFPHSSNSLTLTRILCVSADVAHRSQFFFSFVCLLFFTLLIPYGVSTLSLQAPRGLQDRWSSLNIVRNPQWWRPNAIGGDPQNPRSPRSRWGACNRFHKT